MIDRAALAAFMAVLETGSFDGAAEKLGLSQPAVTARIRNLEDQIGAVLILRTRPAMATEAGAKLQSYAETMEQLEAQALRGLGGPVGEQSGPVRIAVTADTAACWLLPALPKRRFLRFDLVIEDQDHTADMLIRGEAAAAITTRSTAISGCDIYDLGPLDYAAFASPDFAADYFANGMTEAELLLAPALTFNRKDQLQIEFARRASGHGFKRLPTHFVPSTEGITEAARVGLGWGVNPLELAQPLFDSAELVRLRADVQLSTQLYWQVPRQNRVPLEDVTAGLRRAARARASRR